MELTLEWIAILIATIAILFTFQANKRAEKHMRLSVKPMLVGELTDRDNGEIEWAICSVGLGPALFQSGFLYRDENSWSLGTLDGLTSFIEATLAAPSKKPSMDEIYLEHRSSGFIMPPETRWSVLQIAPGVLTNEERWEFRKNLSKVEYRLTFRSIYDEKFEDKGIVCIGHRPEGLVRLKVECG